MSAFYLHTRSSTPQNRCTPNSFHFLHGNMDISDTHIHDDTHDTSTPKLRISSGWWWRFISKFLYNKNHIKESRVQQPHKTVFGSQRRQILRCAEWLSFPRLLTRELLPLAIVTYETNLLRATAVRRSLTWSPFAARRFTLISIVVVVQSIPLLILSRQWFPPRAVPPPRFNGALRTFAAKSNFGYGQRCPGLPT